jgi:hypothetical protein
MARRLQMFLSVLLIGFASFARLRERNDVRTSAIDASRDDRHTDGVAKSVVKGRAHDDVGLVVDLLTDPARGLIEFVECEIAAPGDGHEQAASASHLVEQRIGDRRFSGVKGATLFAARPAPVRLAQRRPTTRLV